MLAGIGRLWMKRWWLGRWKFCQQSVTQFFLLDQQLQRLLPCLESILTNSEEGTVIAN